MVLPYFCNSMKYKPPGHITISFYSNNKKEVYIHKLSTENTPCYSYIYQQFKYTFHSHKHDQTNFYTGKIENPDSLSSWLQNFNFIKHSMYTYQLSGKIHDFAVDLILKIRLMVCIAALFYKKRNVSYLYSPFSLKYKTVFERKEFLSIYAL